MCSYLWITISNTAMHHKEKEAPVVPIADSFMFYEGDR